MNESSTKKRPSSYHGMTSQRGLDEGPFSAQGPMIRREPGTAPEKLDVGRFGRMFPQSSYSPTNEAIHALAETMREQPVQAGDNPGFPIGFAFLGQFIDHDITLDATTDFGKQADPAGVQDFRTPNLDLDNVYGSGPDVSRHMYDTSNPQEARLPFRLLLDAGRPFDLPRNSQGQALIGDPRNDENYFVSQIQLAMIKFHNAVVDALLNDGYGAQGNRALFREAQRLVRWHYQWIVVHEFLPLIAGQAMVDDVLKHGRKVYTWEKAAKYPFIPVEFSAAAYRLGHTLIRETYKVNAERPVRTLFEMPSFGSPRLEAADKIDWTRFFEFPGQLTPQKARRIDAKVTPALFDLPFIDKAQDAPASLPERNMLRAKVFGLPSGQQVAEIMKVKAMDNKALGIDHIAGLSNEAPLWYYILKESEFAPNDSKHLGPVGGRIVTEVIIGLLQGNEGNYLHNEPAWKPTLPSQKAGEFTMVDLLRFAGA